MFDERKYALLVEGLASKAWQRLPVGAYDDEEHARSAASEVVDEYRSHTMTFMEAASILDLSNNSEAGFVAGLQSVVRPDHTKSFVLDAAEAALVEDVALAVLDIYAPGAQEEPVSTLEEDIEAADTCEQCGAPRYLTRTGEVCSNGCPQGGRVAPTRGLTRHRTEAASPRCGMEVA